MAQGQSLGRGRLGQVPKRHAPGTVPRTWPLRRCAERPCPHRRSAPADVDRGVVVSRVGLAELTEIEIDAPGPDEVLVRLEASGVCHSDLHVLETGWAHPLPVLLGHEGAGVVEAVGDGVEHVAPGDPVVLGWRSPCGRCPWCLRGDPRRCRTPPGPQRRLRLPDGTPLTQTLQIGTFTTRTVVHGAAAIPLPAELPPEQACLIGCAIATGVFSVLETARVWEGARVAVIGCGAVGLSAIQGARLARAAEIYAIDVEESKSEAARSFGATHTGPSTRLDFVFDVVGHPETVAKGLEMLGHAGTLVYIGLPQPGATAAFDLNALFDRRARIVVSHGGDHLPAEDFPRLARWAADGELDLAGMVSKTVGLEDVPRAFDDMRAGDVIRSVVRL
jgi:S-(hydroxymethyl)mycothiol dehydrogenase